MPPDQPVLPEPEGTANDPLMPVVPPIVDPLAQTLDALEASIEGMSRMGDWVFEDPLAEMLDCLEYSLEGQVKHPPEGWAGDDPEPAAGKGEPRKPTGPANILTGPGPLREAPPPHSDRREPFFSRERGRPIYYVMGGGAGIHGDSPALKGYCHLRKQWVWEDDCAQCSDYEASSQGSGGADGDYCRHTLTPTIDEEGADDGE